MVTFNLQHIQALQPTCALHRAMACLVCDNGVESHPLGPTEVTLLLKTGGVFRMLLAELDSLSLMVGFPGLHLCFLLSCPFTSFYSCPLMRSATSKPLAGDDLRDVIPTVQEPVNNG